jgi:hypothetical protein
MSELDIRYVLVTNRNLNKEIGMFKSFIGAAIVAALSLASPALAKPISIKPVPREGQTVRYDKGNPTIEDDMTNGAVRIMPIPSLDHGSLQFMVVAYNKGPESTNFGVENVFMTRGDTRIACFTKDELESKAKNRAMWSQIGIAMLAGVAAAAQNNNTLITTTTPRGGVYTTRIQNPGLSGGQVATLAAGAGGIALSQYRLQQTLDSLNDEILQTTTVDTDGSYGGRVVLNKIKKTKYPENISITVNFAGEDHVFDFIVTK